MNEQAHKHKFKVMLNTFFCFLFSVRLSGSTIINYGQLEMYDGTEQQWLGVCDYNFNIHHATVICRQLGYRDGLVQNGSPLGQTTSQISIVDVVCDGTNSACTFRKGTCQSERYVAIYCSPRDITSECKSFVNLLMNNTFDP